MYTIIMLGNNFLLFIRGIKGKFEGLGKSGVLRGRFWIEDSSDELNLSKYQPVITIYSFQGISKPNC